MGAAGTVLSLRIARDDTAPSEVRAAMRELEDIGWILGDAMLLASELVTDSVLHSGCPQDDPIEVEVTLEEDHLTISVSDCAGAERHPLRAESPPSRMALALVRMLARRWGVERQGRRRVWVELARPDARSDAG